MQGMTSRGTDPIKEGKYYHILVGTIINGCVLNLEVITEKEREWQISRVEESLI